MKIYSLIMIVGCIGVTSCTNVNSKMKPDVEIYRNDNYQKFVGLEYFVVSSDHLKSSISLYDADHLEDISSRVADSSSGYLILHIRNNGDRSIWGELAITRLGSPGNKTSLQVPFVESGMPNVPKIIIIPLDAVPVQSNTRWKDFVSEVAWIKLYAG